MSAGSRVVSRTCSGFEGRKVGCVSHSRSDLEGTQAPDFISALVPPYEKSCYSLPCLPLCPVNDLSPNLRRLKGDSLVIGAFFVTTHGTRRY